MTENERFTLDFDDPRAVWIDDNITNKSYTVINDTLKKKNIQEIVDCLNELHEENEELKIRNKGKQAFINKQYKIIKLLYNQCKDFKEILDDSNITYPIDERLEKFFEEGVKL